MFFKGSGQPCIYQSNGSDIMTYEDAEAFGSLDAQKELNGETITIGNTVLRFDRIAIIEGEAHSEPDCILYLQMKIIKGEYSMNSAFVTESFFDDSGRALAGGGYMFYQKEDGTVTVAFKNADTGTKYIDVVYDMFGRHSECRLDNLQG